MRARTESDTGFVPCPWCGSDNEVWEWSDGTHVTECEHCEQPIELTIETTRTFTMLPLVPTPEELRATSIPADDIEEVIK